MGDQFLTADGVLEDPSSRVFLEYLSRFDAEHREQGVKYSEAKTMAGFPGGAVELDAFDQLQEELCDAGLVQRNPVMADEEHYWFTFFFSPTNRGTRYTELWNLVEDTVTEHDNPAVTGEDLQTELVTEEDLTRKDALTDPYLRDLVQYIAATAEKHPEPRGMPYGEVADSLGYDLDNQFEATVFAWMTTYLGQYHLLEQRGGEAVNEEEHRYPIFLSTSDDGRFYADLWHGIEQYAAQEWDALQRWLGTTPIERSAEQRVRQEPGETRVDLAEDLTPRERHVLSAVDAYEPEYGDGDAPAYLTDLAETGLVTKLPRTVGDHLAGYTYLIEDAVKEQLEAVYRDAY